MPIPAYRAKQSTDTTGTVGTIVLNAAGTNARSFAAAFGASSRRIMYAISWASGFEIGYGDFDGGTPGNLTRSTVVASSNAGALVTLPGGTKDVFAVFDPGAREVLAISGTTTLALADMSNVVVFTGASAATLNLPAIATTPTGSGWTVRNAGTAAITIDPNGAETINGAATLVLQAGQAAFIFDGGAAWECIIAGGTSVGAATSPNVRITGTTTITGFGTAANGVTRQLRFAAALTLTYNATSLILPGAANITTAAGDTATAVSLGSGNWVVTNYTRWAFLPSPMITTSTGAPGSFQPLNSGSGSALVLPAGGVWLAWWFGITAATGAVTGVPENIEAAGGTTAKAGSAGIAYYGWAFRKS